MPAGEQPPALAEGHLTRPVREDGRSRRLLQPAGTPSPVIRPRAARAAESVSRSGPSERIAFHGELESKGLTKRAADARCPPEASQRAPVRPRVSPHPRVIRRTDGRRRSNGKVPRASVTGEGRPGRRSLPAPVQDPSRPSRPTYGPSRRLLFLALQEQLDALSDEGRGLLVPRVRDQLPHKVPRRLIHAEGDDSGFCFHSLSSFA